MPMVSVRAVYEQGVVRFLEKAPVQEPCEVLVTFLGPQPATSAGSPVTFQDLRGLWAGLDIGLEGIEAGEYRGSEGGRLRFR